MATKKRIAISTKALLGKVRKPTAPPTRVAEDERRYKRARELERIRRESK